MHREAFDLMRWLRVRVSPGFGVLGVPVEMVLDEALRSRPG